MEQQKPPTNILLDDTLVNRILDALNLLKTVGIKIESYSSQTEDGYATTYLFKQPINEIEVIRIVASDTTVSQEWFTELGFALTSWSGEWAQYTRLKETYKVVGDILIPEGSFTEALLKEGFRLCGKNLTTANYSREELHAALLVTFNLVNLFE